MFFFLFQGQPAEFVKCLLTVGKHPYDEGRKKYKKDEQGNYGVYFNSRNGFHIVFDEFQHASLFFFFDFDIGSKTLQVCNKCRYFAFAHRYEVFAFCLCGLAACFV